MIGKKKTLDTHGKNGECIRGANAGSGVTAASV